MEEESWHIKTETIWEEMKESRKAFWEQRENSWRDIKKSVKKLITWLERAANFPKCSTSIQIPHIQTLLTKHIKVAALGQFINLFLQSYMLLLFLFT